MMEQLCIFRGKAIFSHKFIRAPAPLVLQLVLGFLLRKRIIKIVPLSSAVISMFEPILLEYRTLRGLYIRANIKANCSMPSTASHLLSHRLFAVQSAGNLRLFCPWLSLVWMSIQLSAGICTKIQHLAIRDKNKKKISSVSYKVEDWLQAVQLSIFEKKTTKNIQASNLSMKTSTWSKMI